MFQKIDKGISSIIILITIFILIVVIGGLIYWRYGQFPDKEEVSNEEIQEEGPADWQIFKNESYGISFRYPSTYAIEELGRKVFDPGKGLVTIHDETIEANKIDQFLILSDKSRVGEPRLFLQFDPDGVGDVCMFDRWYESVIKDGRIEILFKEDDDRMEGSCKELGPFDRRTAWLSIGHSPRWGWVKENKNENFIIFIFSFDRDGPNYEEEFEQIIKTIRITKQDIYEKPPVDSN